MPESQSPADEGIDGSRVLYVVSPESMQTGGAEIDLAEVWGAIWASRWLVVGITLLFAALGATYALLATEWYQARVVMVPSEDESSLGIGGQLGGLASMVGISVGSGSAVEPISVLQSRDFARQFIEDHDLVTVLLADKWNPELGKWKSPDPSKWPDVRDAVTYFHRSVLRVTEDIETGVVTLTVEWTDPEAAAHWANTLVKRLNDRMRARVSAEANRNAAYLKKEMETTNVVTLQEAIANLLEAELQKSMLAQGNEDFAYRVVDGAEVPKRRSRPKRTLVVLVAAVLGGVFSMFLVWGRHRTRRSSVAASKID